MVISYLVLLVMFARIFADSCENMVRLADLQDIIKNQTELIQEQKRANEEIGQVVEDQKNMIKKQAKLINVLKTGESLCNWIIKSQFCTF